MKAGLIIFNTSAATLCTDDTGRRTLSPTTPYYKLTGEITIHRIVMCMKYYFTQEALVDC